MFYRREVSGSPVFADAAFAATTNNNHDSPIFPNLAADKKANGPNQLWVADITHVAIGIILLIGIVKKNGIMLVDFALVGERERGLSSEDAIHEACGLRFRPILITTLCALLGGVPLMLA